MTTHRRPRFAPGALVLLATTLAATDAAADQPLAPTVRAEDPTLPDLEPFVPPTRMASPSLVAVGATLMGVGATGIALGAVVSADQPDNPGAPDMFSPAALMLGGVLLAAGIPLFAIGIREVPDTETASAVPVVRVGAGAADLTWQF